MGLESATYISGLNSSNPVTADQKTEGDDHLRLIKSTLLATFPNITGVVTSTHTELNRVAGGGAAVSFSAYLNSTQSSGNTILFDTERYDTHSAYATGTGIFTVPVTGYYIVTASAVLSNSSGAAHTPYIALYHNATASGYSACYTAATGQTVASLNVSIVGYYTVTDTLKISATNEAAAALSATFQAVALPGTTFSAHRLA